MKKSKIATTIAEAMIVTLVIVSGLTGVYSIYNSSIKLTIQTENKIQAIQIAREGIEAITNIRDTNWLLFTSNTKNCWKVLDYNSNCITGTTGYTNIANNGNYKVLRDTNNRWILIDGTSVGDIFSNSSYKDFYKIYLDSNGLYTHTFTGDTRTLSNNKILFTRQIKTNYLNPITGVLQASATDGLLIKSIVRWQDSGGTKVNEIILDTIITNNK